MRILKTLCTGTLATLACLLAPLPAGAAETIDVDLNTNSTRAGAVRSATVLAAGQRYVVAVVGTGSIWGVSQWSNRGATCGGPEERPLIASPGVENGPVGWDAETVFAVPPGVSFFPRCSAANIPFHVPTQSGGGFKMDIGDGFKHREPLGGERSVPRADHRYVYEIDGRGQAAALAFLDESEQRRPDDYGIIRVTIWTDAECAAINCRAGTDRASDNVAPVPGARLPGAANASDITLPSSRSCASRRRFDVQLRQRRGVRFVRATVALNGKVVKTVRRGSIRAKIDLRGLPRGAFTVVIRATTSRGQLLTSRRKYRTCAKKSESKRSKPKAPARRKSG
jgi:hypothetical protein